MNSKILISSLITLFMSMYSFGQVDDTTYQEIDGVLVTSEKERQVVFEDTRFYVVDFTLYETKTLLLLKRLGKYILCQLDEELQLDKELELKQNARALYMDCFGNTHLIARDSVYLILETTTDFLLTEPQPKEQFLEAMEKCVGISSERIIFEEFTRNYQFHEFYAVDATNGHRETIYTINDSVRARSLKDAAEDLYSHILTDAEKFASHEASAEEMSEDEEELQTIKNWREMNARMDRIMFFEQIVNVPEYNPLFVINDTLHFFNHFDGRLDQLNQFGKTVNSHPLEYHLNDDWEHELYFDPITHQFYGLFLEDGTYKIKSISIMGTELNSSSTPITEHARPRKILIRNGYAYYTFRPNSDANLNKLYRQKL